MCASSPDVTREAHKGPLLKDHALSKIVTRGQPLYPVLASFRLTRTPCALLLQPAMRLERLTSRFALATLIGFIALARVTVASGQGTRTSPSTLVAQNPARPTSGTALGLTAAAAIGIHVGYARVEGSIDAFEGGATLDLGHIATQRLRLTTDLSYMRSQPHTERIETEGKTYRAFIQDLSGAVDLALLTRSPTAIVVPFFSGGVGLHVLSSAFRSLTIDTRYNTNNFSVQGSAGVRMRLGSTSRRAVVLSVQRIQANNVSRSAVHLGLQALFNDLARGQ
jgi:hypothetical protein